MIRRKALFLIPAGLLLAAVPSFADSTFTDSTFNLANYAGTATYQSDASIGVVHDQCSSCGNPAGPTNTALQIEFTLPNGGVTVFALVNSTFSYNPGTQGDIISIDASADKDITLSVPPDPSNVFGNAFRPVIEQDGTFYLAGIGGPNFTGGSTGYLTLGQTGLVASDFVSFDFTTGLFGTANPNFDGDPMLFGLAQGISFAGPISVEADYDNLSFVVHTPEPSTFLLLALGLAGLAIVSRRRFRLG
jgi:PEP-CTERM motif